MRGTIIFILIPIILGTIRESYLKPNLPYSLMRRLQIEIAFCVVYYSDSIILLYIAVVWLVMMVSAVKCQPIQIHP
jgi:hypothetical protein